MLHNRGENNRRQGKEMLVTTKGLGVLEVNHKLYLIWPPDRNPRDRPESWMAVATTTCIKNHLYFHYHKFDTNHINPFLFHWGTGFNKYWDCEMQVSAAQGCIPFWQLKHHQKSFCISVMTRDALLFLAFYSHLSTKEDSLWRMPISTSLLSFLLLLNSDFCEMLYFSGGLLRAGCTSVQRRAKNCCSWIPQYAYHDI